MFIFKAGFTWKWKKSYVKAFDVHDKQKHCQHRRISSRQALLLKRQQQKRNVLRSMQTSLNLWHGWSSLPSHRATTMQ